MKRSHVCKSYASMYSVKILNSINPELQRKDAEPPIKVKLIDLLSELKSINFTCFTVSKKNRKRL